MAALQVVSFPETNPRPEKPAGRGGGGRGGRGGGISPEVGIPKGANKINEELEKIWGIE